MSALPLLLLAAVAFCTMQQAFVSPRGAESARMTAVAERAARTPEMARQIFGSSQPGQEGKIVEDPNQYILWISILFFVSVWANIQGFFGPW
jgi:hypothetical protein